MRQVATVLDAGVYSARRSGINWFKRYSRIYFASARGDSSEAQGWA
jgi:hypothetical protein